MTIDVDQLPLDLGDEIARLMRRFYPLLISRAFGDASGVLGIDLAYDLENPFVQEVLDQLAKQVRSVAETTRDDIRWLVGQAASEGWSTADLARELRQLGETLSSSRADVIARTETATAYSRGSLLAFEESGVVSAVEWLAGPDECDICQPLSGTRVALGEPFADGILHPPLHPNCRCALAPIVE
jgi:SPP1 gp7 family putative phage head morphogenesis protein